MVIDNGSALNICPGKQIVWALEWKNWHHLVKV